MNFSRGQTGTKVRWESRLFSQGKTPEFTKMGEIHELFVLAVFLVSRSFLTSILQDVEAQKSTHWLITI